MSKIFTIICFLIFYNLSFGEYKEVQIPTREENPEKKYLFADIYVLDSTVKKPTILIQTPYNKITYRTLQSPPQEGGTQLPFDTINYNFVVLDWRGFFANNDKDIQGKDRGEDGYDVVEWIAQQSWSDGKVGTYGGSALGLIQFQTAKLHPPHLVCSAPFIKDFLTKYENYYYGGDYRKEQCEQLQRLGFIPTSFILMLYKDSFYWDSLEIKSDCSSLIKIPMLMCSGWFDHYPSDCIRAFHDLRNKSNPDVKDKHKLIMGPWLHSSIGLPKQGELTFTEAEDIPNQQAQKFFDYYLRNINNGWENEPVIKYFEMGSNVWKTTDNWYNVADSYDTLYFNNNHLLTDTPSMLDIKSIDSVEYNPKDPSPTYGGSRFNPFDPKTPMGPLDQRDEVESRSDALVYTTAPLQNDFVLNGTVSAELYVSADKEDTDFGIRLCDVYPDGRSILLTQGIKRMRFRNSLSNEELMTPGEIYPVKIELNDLSNNFLAGHSIRVIVTNSNYPMFDINLNNGGELYKPGDTLIAKTYLHHWGNYISKVIFPVTNTTGINNDLNVAAQIEIFPNPTKANITLSCQNVNSENVGIELFNIYGIIVKSLNIQPDSQRNFNETISISNETNGIYFIKFKFNDSVFIKKIILNR
ncbi:MAG: CocE/NonD family hydrolase [Bacteroidetes bacterium]|nr:MAG: CocE/NonD family hydrolase [Bacteroidota bacterium]